MDLPVFYKNRMKFIVNCVYLSYYFHVQQKTMPTQSQIIHYLSTNKHTLCRKYHLTKLGIFGSYARNEQTRSSDLDLLVEFEDNTADLSDKKNILKHEIQAIFQIPVDICREKYIKPLFRNHILADAIYV